jgi:murein DD-endopeptidase MepM/ murein hydrolase activator NlpD
MIIFRGIKSNLITQLFGKANTNLGLLDMYHQLKLEGHNGFDFACDNGTTIYFPCSCKGTVIGTGIYNDGCVFVKILTNDDAGLLVHRFLHLKDVNVSPGQIIESGDLIAHSNNTGKYSSGPHLHYDISPVVLDGNSYKYLSPENGYGGQIDPTLYFRNIYILDYLAMQNQQIINMKKIITWLQELIYKLRG